MITKQQALTENYFHAERYTNSKGTFCRVWRRNGETQTWKSKDRELEFKIPVKYGLYDYGYITHSNASQFHTEDDCTEFQGK